MKEIPIIPEEILLRNSKSPNTVERDCTRRYASKAKDSRVISEILKLSVGQTYDAWLYTRWITKVETDSYTGAGQFFLRGLQIDDIIDDLIIFIFESESYSVHLNHILLFHPAVLAYLLC